MRRATVFTALAPLILGCAVSTPAQEPSLAHKGRVIIHESAIERSEDVGTRAHTPFGGSIWASFPRLCLRDTSFDCLATGCNPNTFKTNPSGGSKAIGIVDAYDYPTAMADVNAFSAQFGLPTLTSATFKVIFAGGTGGCAGSQPGNNPGWEGEQALDIE